MPAAIETAPSAVAVTGGAGAVGLHFVRHVLAHTSLPLRVLVHRTKLPADLQTPRVLQVEGSLLEPRSLDPWLCPGAAVVHLAWSSAMTAGEHLRSIDGLAEAAVRNQAIRFVHCSTAVVAGSTPAAVVTEGTPCEPTTDYERDKYRIEKAIEMATAGRLSLTVLRPTAVFGPGLQNLLSLIDSLRQRPAFVNYARASLFGRRNMHLVPVETVASALLFAALGLDHREDPFVPACYIVSADDEPGGDFSAVEGRIRRGLGFGATLPPLSIPSVVLRLLLKGVGRSDTNPRRVYDGSRLRKAGFVPPVRLEAAIDRYVAWCGMQFQTRGTP